MTSSERVVLAKDLLNCLFFIVVGGVTLLTYRKARETLLQPIKTEVFKLQLQELSSILKMFVGKGEVELRDDFALTQMLVFNAFAMYDDYSECFFDVELDREQRPYQPSECPTSLFTQAYAEKHLLPLVGHVKEETSDEQVKEKPDPRIRAALWADYLHGDIRIPRKHSDLQDEFQRVLESPIIPKQLVTLIEEYLEIVSFNVMLVSEVLTESAKEMPEKYPTLSKLEKGTLDWLRSRYTKRMRDLKPKADEIVTFVRAYYGADEILEAKPTRRFGFSRKGRDKHRHRHA